jgi:hypothetical protein
MKKRSQDAGPDADDFKLKNRPVQDFYLKQREREGQVDNLSPVLFGERGFSSDF